MVVNPSAERPESGWHCSLVAQRGINGLGHLELRQVKRVWQCGSVSQLILCLWSGDYCLLTSQKIKATR